ncbi:MAG: YgjV family protein [Clostridia bacterium]|nr:YgjV family protein [Clostridia bacterium]
MTAGYIISQIFAILGILTLGASYLYKNKRQILILTLLATIFYGMHNFFLGATTGVTMNCINIVANIWFYTNEKKQKRNSLLVLITLLSVVIIFGILSFQDMFSLIPIIATILFIYSIWQDNTRVYKLIALPKSIFWISYNIYLKSIFGIITEVVLLIFKIVGIINHKKRKRR